MSIFLKLATTLRNIKILPSKDVVNGLNIVKGTGLSHVRQISSVLQRHQNHSFLKTQRNDYCRRLFHEICIKSSYPSFNTVVGIKPIPETVWENSHQWNHQTALVCGTTGRNCTYDQARGFSRRFAISLLRLGYKPGDVIAIILPNLPEYPIALLGILEAGLIVTTVNPAYTKDEITYQLFDSEAKAVVTLPSLLPNIAFHWLQDVFLVGVSDIKQEEGPCQFHSFASLADNFCKEPAMLFPELKLRDVAVLPYSSGTTGLPKGVMLTHSNIVTNIRQMNHPDLLTCEPTTDDHQEIALAVLPFYHIYALNVIMLSKMAKGVRIVTLSKFEPESFLLTLEKYKFTMLFVVPPLLQFMANHPNIKHKHIEAVHSICCGAAPLSISAVDAFYAKTGSSAVFQEGYGLTETSPVISGTPCDRNRIKIGSCGQLVSNTRLKVIDIETGDDVGEGSMGEICVRGPQIMKGYLNNPKATANTIDKDGWLHTGDIGYYDKDKFIHVIDRLKELIKVNALQVAPAELEEVIRTHPSVAEAAVVGVAHERFGEAPRAFIVRKPGANLSEKEIDQYVREKVASHKRLAGGIIFVETIPKSPSGKILRRCLNS